jgi:hypothetical protein
MKKAWILVLACMLISLTATGAMATVYNMNEVATYNNGAFSDSYPQNDFTAPLTWTKTFSAAGNYNYILFIDPEIDQTINTFFNEYGVKNGSAAAGLSWEIDEPGYTYGDIYNNVKAGALDNSNNVPVNAPDDVSLALGWKFTVGANETVTLNFKLSDIMPETGSFYLAQFDPDSNNGNGAALYFTTSLDKKGGRGQVPEPSLPVLLGSALAGLVFARKGMQS